MKVHRTFYKQQQCKQITLQKHKEENYKTPRACPRDELQDSKNEAMQRMMKCKNNL